MRGTCGWAEGERRLRKASKQAQMNQRAFPAIKLLEKASLTCQPWGTLTLGAESQALGSPPGGQGRGLNGEAEGDP